MEFSKFKATRESNLPPPLEIGTVLKSITKIEANTFDLNGVKTKGMRVFADNKEYRTSSTILMKQLEEFFNEHQGETLDNVRIVQPRGKRYLTLESA